MLHTHHSNIIPHRLLRLRRGFTLIELLVVIAMVAIIASLAAPSFNDLRINQKLSSYSSDLFASTIQARNEAMRLNRQVTIAPISGGDWKTGWRVFVDMNTNKTYDSATDTLVVTSPAFTEPFVVTGPGGGAAPTNFSFDSRGFLVDFANSRVIIKSSVTNREKQLIVSATGRARLCDPKLSSNVCSATSQ
jgi:type IV fimbrial biogenesis protein FimT